MKDADELPPPTVIPHRPSARPTREKIDRLLTDQRSRCEKGESFRAEIYLGEDSELANDTDGLLDLVYNERLLRESKGERPSLEEYLTRFPQLNEHLKIQFEVDNALEGDGTSTVAGQTQVIDKSADGLANYEILEVLGRGGMGVVYKARQKSLNRIVALKMVRSGGHAGEEDLKRFNIEAEAVARLQHPNIVQIYEVGQTEDGPYLALEFIDGGNLASQLETTWSPTRAAKLTQTLAEAMHYAHERGIVHRDLKPANILLQGSGFGGQGAETRTRKTETEVTKKDGSVAGRILMPTSSLTTDLRAPTPKITDFGLAKMLIEGSQGPTQTGDFLGTPCYTAPEQASGRIHEIGPGSDVYALGAILYELLTGRPPFEGATILDTLDQVRSKEPVPPTRLVHRVPRDLETICLKCLEKDPRRRYTTAALLAEDLERFLGGQPILARPVGWVERTWKLVKRYPWAATAAMLALFLVVGGLVGALWYAYDMGVANEATNQQRLKAEENLLVAVKAVRSILVEVAAVDLADVPQLEPVRKKILLEAKGMMDGFLAERGDDAMVRHLAGRAYACLGDIHDSLDESKSAEAAFRKAIRLLQAEKPSIEQRQELARVHNNLGMLFKKLGASRFVEAEKELREALSLRTRLVHESNGGAEFVRDLATSHHDLGTVIARLPKRREDAEKEYRSALEMQTKLSASAGTDAGYARDQARTMNNLGILLGPVKPGEAEAILEEAVAIHKRLVARAGGSPRSRRELARTLNNLANAHWMRGSLSKAAETFESAIDGLKELVADFSKVPAYRQELAGAYRNRANFFEGQERFADAERDYRISLTIRLQLVKDFDDVPDYRQGLAKVHVDLVNLREQQRLYHLADHHYRDAVEILQGIAKPNGRPTYYFDLGLTYHQWGLMHVQRSRFRDFSAIVPLVAQSSLTHGFDRLGVLIRAQGAVNQAPELLWKADTSLISACEADSQNKTFRDSRAELLGDLALLELDIGNHETAAKVAQELARFGSGEGVQIIAAKRLARCAGQAARDDRLSEEERRTLAERYAKEAIRLLTAIRNIPAEERESREFDAIRERDDFKQLFDNVKKNMPQIV